MCVSVCVCVCVCARARACICVCVWGGEGGWAGGRWGEGEVATNPFPKKEWVAAEVKTILIFLFCAFVINNDFTSNNL